MRNHSTNFKNEGYLIPVLEQVKYYFKANYNATEYDANSDGFALFSKSLQAQSGI